MDTVRSMTTLKTKTLGQILEVARHANDEKTLLPGKVSAILRYPHAINLPLTQYLMMNILQHLSRTPPRHNHPLIVSPTLMLMVDLVELQPRRTTVDQSNPLVISPLLTERYASRHEKLPRYPLTTKMTMTCLMMKRTWSLRVTGRPGRKRMFLQLMRCSITDCARILVSDTIG